MNTTIYYFSATGNSCVVAKKLQNRLQNCILVPIVKLSDKSIIYPETQKIGIVFPIYYSGIPKLVYNFIKKLNLDKIEYIFSVPTKDNSIKCIAMNILNNLLKEKNKKLSSGFYIKLFSTDIPNYNLPKSNIRNKILKRSENRINKIAEKIENNTLHIDKSISYPSLYKSYNNFLKYVNEKDKKFTVEDSCISCGMCEQICPVNDIILVNGKPKWLGKCEQCFACLHFCPAECIQVGNSTKNKERYHHPDITIDDIIEQKSL